MKKLIFSAIAFIGLFVCPDSFVKAQGVGVNSSGSPADPSAIFDASSTTLRRGMRLSTPPWA